MERPRLPVPARAALRRPRHPPVWMPNLLLRRLRLRLAARAVRAIPFPPQAAARRVESAVRLHRMAGGAASDRNTDLLFREICLKRGGGAHWHSVWFRI